MWRSKEHRDWQTVSVVKFNMNHSSSGLGNSSAAGFSFSCLFFQHVSYLASHHPSYLSWKPAPPQTSKPYLFNQPFSANFHLTQMPSGWAGFKSCLAVLAGARRVNQARRRKGLGSSKSNHLAIQNDLPSTFLLLWFFQF